MDSFNTSIKQNNTENENSLIERLTKDVKGTLTTLIILGIIKKNDRIWGYQIKKELMNISGSKEEISDSSLYTVLRKLEQVYKVVKSTMEERRRYYSITKDGEEHYSKAIQYWYQLMELGKSELNKLWEK